MTALPPPIWDLPGMPWTHMSGPLHHPTPDECGICRRLGSAIDDAEQGGRIAHAKLYRTQQADHQRKYPHKGIT
ncbi:hypothetical protein [Streptomyces luteireticuli]|uniref:hypothetical protein n=1 Tax=Streptomyces luteireticuli TaxID=173858 RepID=UPI00355787A8